MCMAKVCSPWMQQWADCARAPPFCLPSRIDPRLAPSLGGDGRRPSCARQTAMWVSMSRLAACTLRNVTGRGRRLAAVLVAESCRRGCSCARHVPRDVRKALTWVSTKGGPASCKPEQNYRRDACAQESGPNVFMTCRDCGGRTCSHLKAIGRNTSKLHAEFHAFGARKRAFPTTFSCGYMIMHLYAEAHIHTLV